MSKLRHSLSFLRGKKDTPPEPIQFKPIPPEQREQSARIRRNNGFPSLKELDEEKIQATVQVSSLHDELERSNNQALRLKTDNERLEAQIQLDSRSQQEMEANHLNVANTLNQRNRFLEAHANALNERLEKAERERDASKSESQNLQSQLKGVTDELHWLRAWGIRVSESQKDVAQLREKVKQLETRNGWLLQCTEGQSKSLYLDKVDVAEREAYMKKCLADREEELKHQVEHSDGQLAKLIMERDEKSAKAKKAESMIEAQIIQLREMKAALEERNATLAEMVAEKATKKEEQGKLLGACLTPRVVLALSFMESRFDRPDEANNTNTKAQQFVESTSTRLLTADLLDVKLSPSQAIGFAQNVSKDTSFRQSLSLLVCAVCHTPRFTSSAGVNEFSAANGGLLSCCQKPVCSACLKRSLIKSVNWGWWQKPTSPTWLSCPAEGCGKFLNIRHAGEFAGRLRALGLVPDRVDKLIRMWSTVLACRTALSSLDPAPTEEALAISRRLHGELNAEGRMKTIFDSCFESLEPDDDGKMPPFNPGKIKMGDVNVVDQDGQTRAVSVPIFMRLLNRRPVECIVCSETLLEIDYGDDTQAWKDLCKNFPGSWMREIQLFPAGLVVGCEPTHEADICRECVRMHLKTQLDQYGRNHCDKLSCPSVGCGRKLAHHDVQQFADKGTFEKFDRFQLLNNLSADSNFRWCLGEGCDNGQLYFDDVLTNPHIACDTCEFEMCFKHEVLWHEGMTCEQFDSQRSEDFLTSAQWIQENSKKCPGEGCGVNIIKGEACFHMTCAQCNFEFCWVCLANWGQIQTAAGYDRDAHNPGCWFRNNNVQPTEVFGEEVQAAAERRHARL